MSSPASNKPTPPTFAALAKGDTRTAEEIVTDEALATLPDISNGARMTKERRLELTDEGYSLPGADATNHATPEPEATPEIPDPDTEHPDTEGEDDQDFTPTPGDIANAQRFIEMFGKEIRYVLKKKEWLIWDGHRWTSDDDLGIEQRAKAFAREFAAHNDGAEAKRLQGVAGREAMVKTARSDYRVTVYPQDLDSNPMLINPFGNINIRSGTLDLRTGQLKDANPDDLITQMTAVRYQPGAKCPLWLKTLGEVLVNEDQSPREDVIAYLQRFAGYMLTGSTEEHVFAILIGDGRNGKGVVINTLQFLLGGYAKTIGANHLLTQRHEEHPTWKSELHQRRLIVCEETNQRRSLDEATVKSLASSEPIETRRMRQDSWTFNPTHKLFLVTNNLPVIHGTDDAIWDRIAVIEFLRYFAPPERDPKLTAKLVEERPGILNWMIQGWLDYQNLGGLYPPPEVLKAIEKYRADSDEVRRFIRDCCNVGEVFKNDKTTTTPLYQAYQLWAADEGTDVDRRLTQLMFGKALEKLNYKSEEPTWDSDAQQTVRYRRGIALKKVSK